MADTYKVVLRGYFDSESSFVKWEPGCPVIVAALQVSRNKDSSEEYLQIRFRNIWNDKVELVEWSAVARFRDGAEQQLGAVQLDTEMAVGEVFNVKPIVLEGSQAREVDLRILRVETTSRQWVSSGEALPCPSRVILPWSSDRVAQRREYFDRGVRGMLEQPISWRCSCGTENRGTCLCSTCGGAFQPANAPCDGAVQDAESYWICACGAPNVESELCWSCGCSKAALIETASEETISRFESRLQEEGEEKKRRARKRNMIALIAAGVLVLAVAIALVVALRVLPALAVEDTYQRAQAEMAEGHYQTAANLFTGIRDYKDVQTLFAQCEYELGVESKERENYQAAVNHFRNAGSYEDARELLAEMETKLAETGDAEANEGVSDEAAESEPADDDEAAVDAEPAPKHASKDALAGTGFVDFDPVPSDGVIDTPYYRVDLSEKLSPTEISKLFYQYSDGFDFQEGRNLGIGFALTLVDTELHQVGIACYSPDWGPQGDFETMELGMVESSEYGTMRVSLYVPVDYEEQSYDPYRDAADKALLYSQCVSLPGDKLAVDDFVLPESSGRKYKKSELRDLSNWELYIARNEIFARSGRRFNNADLQEYFNGKDWYNGQWDPEDFDSWFTPNTYEKANADLIGEIEREKDSPYLG